MHRYEYATVWGCPLGMYNVDELNELGDLETMQGNEYSSEGSGSLMHLGDEYSIVLGCPKDQCRVMNLCEKAGQLMHGR